MMMLVGDDLYLSWLAWNRWFSWRCNGDFCLDPVVLRSKSVVELTHSPHGTRTCDLHIRGSIVCKLCTDGFQEPTKNKKNCETITTCRESTNLLLLTLKNSSRGTIPLTNTVWRVRAWTCLYIWLEERFRGSQLKDERGLLVLVYYPFMHIPAVT